MALDGRHVQVRIERARVSVTLATWHRDLEGIRRAVPDFELALQQSLRAPGLWADYLRCLIQLGRIDEAVEAADRALRHCPGNRKLLGLQQLATRRASEGR